MDSSNNAAKENIKENESAKPNPNIENIKSRYILSKIIKLVFLTNFRKFKYIKKKKFQII